MNDDQPSTTQSGDPVKGHVLIISYHFPPLNVVSSFRPEAFARYLPRHGLRTTVLTLDWEPIPNPHDVKSIIYAWHRADKPVVIEERDGARVIRLPRYRTFAQRLIDLALALPVSRSIAALAGQVFGCFNLQVNYAHLAMKRYLRQHLRMERYDAVIATMSPDEHIRLGAWVGRRTGALFVGDYRDAFDKRIMEPAFKPGPITRLRVALKRLHHRRWMRHSALLTSISSPLVDALCQATGAPRGLEVRNGFFPERVRPDPALIDAQRFLITYGGRIYPDQDPAPLLQALNEFMVQLDPQEQTLVTVRFYGIQDAGKERQIRASLDPRRCEVVRLRIPNTEIYDRLAESSILLVMDVDTPGAYTGKFMDHVGCERNILMIPSDQGVIAELIQQGRLGLATNDVAEASAFLLKRFREWQANGRPTWQGIPDVVAACSRPAQTAVLAQALLDTITRRQLQQGGGAR